MIDIMKRFPGYDPSIDDAEDSSVTIDSKFTRLSHNCFDRLAIDLQCLLRRCDDVHDNAAAIQENKATIPEIFESLVEADALIAGLEADLRFMDKSASEHARKETMDMLSELRHKRERVRASLSQHVHQGKELRKTSLELANKLLACLSGIARQDIELERVIGENKKPLIAIHAMSAPGATIHEISDAASLQATLLLACIDRMPTVPAPTFVNATKQIS